VHEIRNGHYTFAEADWENISLEGMSWCIFYLQCLVSNIFAFLPAAQDLIRKLLTVDPAERITVNEAMVSMDAMDVFVSI
jgi:hypothetical protein